MRMPAYLGQHLLSDDSIRHDIAQCIGNYCHDHDIIAIVEIGPGKGSLTDLIWDIAPYFLACELDQRMVSYLSTHKTRDMKHKILIHDDALTCDIVSHLKHYNIDSTRTLIVGNLPYYITSPLLQRYACPSYAGGVFLIQDDVTAKIVTSTPKKSFLRRKLTASMSIHKAIHVPPSAFTPPPKVQSSVIVASALPYSQRQTRVSPLTYDIITKLSHSKRKTIGANAKQAGRDIHKRDPVVCSQRIEQLGWNDIHTLQTSFFS